jgi:hypothetical protein
MCFLLLPLQATTFDTSPSITISVSVILLGLILTPLLAPILPVVSVLRSKKQDLLSEVGGLIQDQTEVLQNSYKKKKGTSEAKRRLDDLLAFETFIADASVVPAAANILRSTLASVCLIALPTLFQVMYRFWQTA